MLPDFRRVLTLFSLLGAPLFLGACFQMQIPDDPADPRRPALERLVYEFGRQGSLEKKMQNMLVSLARDKGTSAVVSALEDVGARCTTTRGRTSCNFTRAQVNRSLDLLFPKYQKTTWDVTISYRLHAKMVEEIEVTAIGTPEFVPNLEL